MKTLRRGHTLIAGWLEHQRAARVHKRVYIDPTHYKTLALLAPRHCI